MTKLMREILKDPNAVFEIEADLPSGNRMIGTIGPVFDGKMSSSIQFRDDPPIESDLELAVAVLNKALGVDAIYANVSESTEGRREQLAIMRKFLGGGVRLAPAERTGFPASAGRPLPTHQQFSGPSGNADI